MFGIGLRPHGTNRTCLLAPLVSVTAILFKSKPKHLSSSPQKSGLCFVFRTHTFLDSVGAVISPRVLRRQFSEESHCMSIPHSYTAHIKHSVVWRSQETDSPVAHSSNTLIHVITVTRQRVSAFSVEKFSGQGKLPRPCPLSEKGNTIPLTCAFHDVSAQVKPPCVGDGLAGQDACRQLPLSFLL